MKTKNTPKMPKTPPSDEHLPYIVRCFALYRERTGGPSHTFHLPSGSTVANLVSSVRQRFPNIAPESVEIVVAVNQAYADHDQFLKQGDEIALIPPVSGGSL